MSEIRSVRCPQCNAEVLWQAESRYRPFCSARCKQLDLGAWASEQYRVTTAPAEDGSTDEPPSETPER
ncbi:MAG: DNA gyrase inhibitor YacG [Rhodocyclales bacterium]|nr:DNA gyrase inhibitor YacG [Rhodocyclales bacterium]